MHGCLQPRVSLAVLFGAAVVLSVGAVCWVVPVIACCRRLLVAVPGCSQVLLPLRHHQCVLGILSPWILLHPGVVCPRALPGWRVRELDQDDHICVHRAVPRGVLLPR